MGFVFRNLKSKAQIEDIGGNGMIVMQRHQRLLKHAATIEGLNQDKNPDSHVARIVALSGFFTELQHKGGSALHLDPWSM